MLIQPVQGRECDDSPESRQFGKKGYPGAQQSATDHVCRIMKSQVNSWKADDQKGVTQRKVAQPSRHDPKAHGKAEEESGVVAGERTPANERIRVGAVRKPKIQLQVVQSSDPKRKY